MEPVRIDANGSVITRDIFMHAMQSLQGRKPTAIAMHVVQEISMEENLGSRWCSKEEFNGNIPLHANILIPETEIRFMQGAELIGEIVNLGKPFVEEL